MKTNFIKLSFTFLFLIGISNVFAQEITPREPVEKVQEENPSKQFNPDERIQDPDLKHHERIQPSNEREIETRKLTPDEIELIKPVWVCASNMYYSKSYTYFEDSFTLQIFNFSHEAVFVRVIKYTKDGEVEHMFENKLEGKHTWDLGNKMFYNTTEGPIEIYASSKAIYPQSVFFKRRGGYYDEVNDEMRSEYAYSACLQWFRVE